VAVNPWIDLRSSCEKPDEVLLVVLPVESRPRAHATIDDCVVLVVGVHHVVVRSLAGHVAIITVQFKATVALISGEFHANLLLR